MLVCQRQFCPTHDAVVGQQFRLHCGPGGRVCTGKAAASNGSPKSPVMPEQTLDQKHLGVAPVHIPHAICIE